MKSMSLLAALREFFGYRPGQTTGDFMLEYKALTEADREFFKREFLTVGYQIV